MKPSRTLDCLVAEKVMGWRDLTEEKVTYSLSDYQEDFIGKTPDGAPGMNLVPPFSTKINAAWEVLFYMKERGFSTNISIGNMTCLVEFQTAKIKTGNNYRVHRGYSEAEDFDERVPHAVCLAALAAVGLTLQGAE